MQRFLDRGFRGRDVTHKLALRGQSLEYLRAGGKTNDPVRINVYPDGSSGVTDGRHRITVARERGENFVQATVSGVGPRGGSLWTYTGLVKI
jgi:hypothetical protein